MTDAPLSPSYQRLLDIVLTASSPMSAAAIAERVHLSQGHVADKLRVLRDLGLIGPTGHGTGATWAPLDKARAIRDAAAEARRVAARKRARAKQCQRLKALALQANEAWAEAPPSRRIVAAGSEPMPFKPAAPVSVFSLADLEAA